MKIRGTSARIEKSYKEELATPVKPSNAYAVREDVVQILLNNLLDRVVRKISDATAQRKPANLASEVDELDRIGRIYTVLQSPQMSGYRDGDADAGAKAIVEILQQARKEFGANEQATHKTTEGAEDVSEEAPEDKKEMEDEQGVKTRHNATPEGAVSKTTDGRRRLGIRGN